MSEPPSTVLVVATGNAGKLREICALLADLPIALHSLRDHPGILLPPEGDDYRGNALAKARSAAQQTGLPSLAEDSGLEVEGLGGAPGPRSSRYGGPELDDAGRIQHLLRALQRVHGDARRARFVCVAAVALPDGEMQVARGECAGRILTAPRGAAGFGYDPVFWSDAESAALAELPEARKNQISHRARALQGLRAFLSQRVLAARRPTESADAQRGEAERRPAARARADSSRDGPES